MIDMTEDKAGLSEISLYAHLNASHLPRPSGQQVTDHVAMHVG
jgi:hypothetical protein